MAFGIVMHFLLLLVHFHMVTSLPKYSVHLLNSGMQFCVSLVLMLGQEGVFLIRMDQINYFKQHISIVLEIAFRVS